MQGNLLKWKRAVLHLECVADTTSPDELELLGKIGENITLEEASEIADWLQSRRDKRYHGTAIFLVENSTYYLVTARHVLFDEDAASIKHKNLINSLMKEDDNE